MAISALFLLMLRCTFQPKNKIETNAPKLSTDFVQPSEPKKSKRKAEPNVEKVDYSDRIQFIKRFVRFIIEQKSKTPSKYIVFPIENSCAPEFKLNAESEFTNSKKRLFFEKEDLVMLKMVDEKLVFKQYNERLSAYFSHKAKGWSSESSLQIESENAFYISLSYKVDSDDSPWGWWEHSHIYYFKKFDSNYKLYKFECI